MSRFREQGNVLDFLPLLLKKQDEFATRSKDAFKEKFGSATTLEFTGKIEGVSVNSVLNTAKVNELHDANIGLSDIIYVDRKLEGENSAVTIGTNGVRNSVGFSGINQATSIDVKDGKELVLVGADGDAGFAMTGTTSTVTGEGAQIRLGSLGLKNAANWQGTTKDITLTDGGDLHVASGKYTTDAINASGFGSEVIVDEGAVYRVAGTTNMGTDSELTNEGNLTLHRLTGTGSTITNNRDLTVENGIDISGELINNDKLKVTGDTSITSGLGSFTNAGNAILAGNLTVEGNLTNALNAVLDTKTMHIVGTIKNNGLIKASDNSTLEGTLTNTGTINLFDKNMEIGANGRLDNTGLTHSITGVGTITVNGLLANVNNADFSGSVLNIAEATAKVTNASTMNLKEVAMTNGSKFTNSGKLASDTKVKGANSTLTMSVDTGSVYHNAGETNAADLTIGTGEVYNTGTLVADNVVINDGGYFLNGRAPVADTALFAMAPRAVTVRKNYTLNAGGQDTNAGDMYIAQGTISGTYTNTNQGKTFAGVSDYFVDGKGLTITKTGVIANAGEFTMGGSLNNAGTIRGDGKLIFKRDGASTNLFENTGTIDVGTLEADNITFTQTDGSITAKNGWFTNSTVNVTKGDMTHAGLGVGNTYTIGDGKSTQTIATANFGTLTSDSNVEILQGGRLNGTTIALDGVKKDTIVMNGGVLSTTLDQIFNDVHHQALDIDASTPDDLVNIEGVTVATGVTSIKDSVSTGINFGWGTVAFDDAVYSANMVTDVLTKLDNDDVDPSGHEGQLEVAFNGKASKTFNVTMANAVKAKDPEGGNTYATFAGETLHNTVTNGQSYDKLYVGNKNGAGATGANVLDNNIGFKQVIGATGGMTVADAHHFVLVGELQSKNDNDYKILDGDLTIQGQGSMVTLGTYGTAEKTNGHILNIALNDGGVLRVRHGDFIGQDLTNADGTIYIGGDGKTTVNGSLLRADNDSSLKLNQYTAEAGSNLVNFGTFTVGTLTGNAGELTNYGTLNATTATLAQNHTNLGTENVDTLNVTGGVFTNGDKDHQKATVAVKNDATVSGGELKNAFGSVTVNGTLIQTAGKVTNDATLTVDGLNQTGGLTTNNAQLNIVNKTASSTLAGELQNAGSLTIEGTNAVTIAQNANVHNTGTMSVKPTINITGGKLHQSSDKTMNVADVNATGGLLQADATTTIKGQHLTINAADKNDVIAQNEGLLDFIDMNITSGVVDGKGTLGTDHSNITVGADGTVKQPTIVANNVTNDGSITTDTITTASGTNNGTLTINKTSNATLTNGTNGKLNLNDTTIASGTLTNTGTLNGKGTVVIAGGKLHQQSATDAKFNNLTVNEGNLTVDTDTIVRGDGQFVVNGDAQTELVVNNGQIIFGNINVTAGTLTGTGTLGDNLSTIVFGTQSHVTQGTINSNVLMANGQTIVDNLHTAAGMNGGDMTINKTFNGDLTNNGTLNLADTSKLQSGTLTNAGTLIGQGTVTLEGATIHQQSTTEATFDNLTINKGSLTVDADKTVTGNELVLNGQGDLVKNEGTVNFADATITQGSVVGTGTFGSDKSDLTVEAQGIVNQGSILANNLVNKGNVTADKNLTIVGSLNNSHQFTTNGTANVTGLTNTGTLNFNQGVNFTGKNTSEGTLNAKGQALNVADKGELSIIGGKAEITAGAVVAGNLKNDKGTLNANLVTLKPTGTLTSNATTTVDKLVGEAGSNIALGGGNLHIKDLTEANGMTFTQTEGTILADKGWFVDSTLNFEGGKFDASTIKDNNGQASGMLGHNTVNIGKVDRDPVVGPDSFKPSDEKVNWKDPYVVVSVDKITSDTILNVGSGGVLDVNKIELDPAQGNTVTIGQGGGLQTSLDQIFDKVSTTVTDIEAINPETGKVDIITDVLATTTVGNVKDTILGGLTFEGGSMVAFDDDDFSIELVASVQNSLDKAGIKDVSQHFLGNFMGDFTIETAHKLIAEQEKLGQSHVLNPGVVFDTTTLHNQTAKGPDTTSLVIGTGDETTSNVISTSMGFKDVAHADKVTINNDKEFVLVGGTRPEDFDWTTGYDDSNKLLTDAADGGLIKVENGTFTMGSWGVADATVGWVNRVELGGESSLITKNGEFAAWEIDAGKGKIDVTEGSILHTNELTTNGSQIHIGGGLTVGKDLALNGTITTDKKGNALYQNVTITQGSMTNAGFEQGKNLIVAEGSSHTNTGTSIWNNVEINGTGSNGSAIPEGGLTGNQEGFKTDSIIQIGSKDDQNNTFDVNGNYVNNGQLQAQEVEQTTVAGDLTNNGQAWYDDMNITADGSSTNVGFEKGDILVVEGTHTNTGTSIWNNVEMNGSGSNGAELAPDAPNGNEEGFKSDSIIQIGSKDDQNNTFDVNGNYVNNGQLQAQETEKTTVAGSLTNNGQAWYDDMDITADGTSTNVGFEKGDILVVEGTHTNTGTSIWNNVEMNGSGSNGAELAHDAPNGNEEGFKSDSIIQIGSKDDQNNTFDVNGNYVNNGQLQAQETEKTTVAGSLTNNGQAWYDDMDITTDGSSTNVGFEKGDILVVEGTHTNTGTSIWNNVEMNGSGSNGAELAPDAPNGNEEGFKTDSIIQIGNKDDQNNKFDINGNYVNNGQLQAQETEKTTVTGSLTNNGQAWYDDMDVIAGGKSENIGFEKGDILVVEGTHTNTGTSIWNEVIIDTNGSGSNGKDSNLVVGNDKDGGDLDDFLIIGGNFNNEGTLDATKTENTEVNGTLTNDGKADYNDMDINKGGTSENNVYEKGDILDVNQGGSWENNGESHWNNINGNGGDLTNNGKVEADKIVIEEGTNLDNTGKIETGELEINGGVVDLGGGSINSDKTTINGGDLIVGNDKPLANENRVDFDTTTDKPINGHIWVIGNGDISFGKDAGKYADQIGAPDIPKVPNRITVTEKVTIGETGSLAIGKDVWKSETDHKDVGDGNLFFGKDSQTVVNIGNFGHDKPVFEGTKPGATVTIEAGAKLELGNLTESGDYILTDKFITAGNVKDEAWIGGWTDDDLHADNNDGSGLDWILDLKWEDQKVIINAKLEDIRNKYPDIVLPDNMNEQLDKCQNAGGADQILTCTIIKNPNLSTDEKTKIINSVAEIGFAAGAMATAFNDANTTADALENRLSMKMDAYRGDASIREGAKGHTLWVDVIGGKQKADSYKASGNVSNGFDADSFGFIMGADHKLAGKNVILGGAFSYLDGSLDSTGDLLATKSEYSSFGLHAYGAWKPTDKTNVIGTFSYLHHNAEATQALPLAFKEATADIDTDLITLGVRGERHFDLTDRVKLIPHVGLRAVYAMGGDYDTKLDGQDAYKNDADATLTFQAPIGIAARADFATAKGWTIVPQADLTVIPVFGDTSQKVDVRGVSTTATDTVEGDFTSSFITQVNFGVQATNEKDLTLGVRYGLNAGGDGKQDHTFKLEVRKAF